MPTGAGIAPSGEGKPGMEAALAKPVDVMANGARDITDEKDEMPWVVAEKILSDMQRAGSGTWKSSVSSDCTSVDAGADDRAGLADQLSSCGAYGQYQWVSSFTN